MSRLVNGDLTLNYQVTGEGEHVVLIHGLGANMAFWYMGIARVLARHYNVVSYDLRGHGRSSAPPTGYDLPHLSGDLAALLDHLGMDRVHLVGHSHGARVALHYALTHPRRTQSLTLADTQLSCVQPRVRLSEWPHWKTWKQQLIELGHVDLPSDDEYISYRLLVGFNRISEGFTHGALARPSHSPSLKRRDMGARGAARWERLLETTTARTEFDDDRPITVDGLRHLDVPTMAMFGEYSHCLPSCDRIRALMPHCEVDIVPEVGHFHPAIKPRRFVRVLGRFLREHPTPPGRPRRPQRARRAAARARRAP